MTSCGKPESFSIGTMKIREIVTARCEQMLTRKIALGCIHSM